MKKQQSNISLKEYAVSEPIRAGDPNIEVNEQGGAQSRIPGRADLLDGEAMLRLSRVLREGCEKYGPNNWRNIPRASHINHALHHIFNTLNPRINLLDVNVEEELDHALCRLMMAVATR